MIYSVKNNLWVLVGKILNISTSFMLESYTDSASKVPYNDLDQVLHWINYSDNENWQQSLQIHISQTIQPKLANKYSLERYWKYLQLSLQNHTQIRHVRSLKMTLNMNCTNWSGNRALESGQQYSEWHNSSFTQRINAYEHSMER
jgi:hypothetical protein